MLTKISYGFSLVFLALGIYFGTLYFPGPFDWQYRVISSLASHVDNPNGNGYFCLFLALSLGCLYLPGIEIYRRVRGSYEKLAKFSLRSFQTGLSFAFLVAIERGFIHNFSEWVPKGHEILALIGFVGLFMAVAGFWWMGLRSLKGQPKWKALVLLATLAPIIGTAGCELYLYVTPNQLGWVGPHWRDLGIPVYLSFAFWQWLTAGGFYVYFGLLLMLTSGRVESSEAPGSPSLNHK